MEEIIKCAIRGGHRAECIYFDPIKDEYFFNQKYNENLVFLDQEFWKAIGKAKGWGNEIIGNPILSSHKLLPKWYIKAIRFHEINLTQGFSKAIEYLEKLIEE